MLRPHTLAARYQYQVEGCEWMRRQGSFLLADERGLGKSLQLLCDFARVRELKPNARLLLVAPNTVIFKWAEVEIPKWTTFSVTVATGTAKQRKEAVWAGTDILVIAYDNIARELEDLNQQGFYYLAFDEAHNIKSYKAQRTKAAFSLRGAKRVMITGSPFLNRVDELWPLLFMIAPTVFPEYWSFVNRYCVFGGYEGRQIIGSQNIGELRAKIAPFMLRRMLADVGQHIPPLSVVPVYFDLTTEQRKVYDMARHELKIEIGGEKLHEFDNPMTRFLRLRQITSGLASVGGPDESGKLDKAMEIMATIPPDKKVVIFGGDIMSLRCMRNRLATVGIDAPVLAGTDEQGRVTNARARQPVVDAFQGSPLPRVLLASHGTCREGIDLYAAHYAIVLDEMWVPELQSQEYGRLQRTGQEHPVLIYTLLGNRTVDARVSQILSTKRITFDAVIGEDRMTDFLFANYAEELLAA